MNDDERLKKTFDKLRENDARGAPSFASVRKKRARRTSPWAVVVPIASAFAAAAVFVVWCNAQDGRPTAVVPAPPAMVRVDDAPLDFLLDVPGLHGAPNFDTSLLRGSIR
jgi:hypothetical protein